MKGYVYQSDFAKKHVAQGYAEGYAEGYTEGYTKGIAQSVLTMLEARGLAVPDAIRERILAEKDPDRLDRWLEKAVVASSVDGVFDETT